VALHLLLGEPPPPRVTEFSKKMKNIILEFKVSMETLDEASLEAHYLILSRASPKSIDCFVF